MPQLMTYHLVCNWINTMGATSGAGTAYPSCFEWGSCYSVFSLICMFCRSLFVTLSHFLLAFVLSVLLRYTDSVFSLLYLQTLLICQTIFIITRRVSLVEQELLTLPEHLSSSPVFSGVCVTRS